jgi:predicted Ser/Thr protein kinase
MPMRMAAATPFLFAMPIVWLLLPVIQADSIGYPDAAAPARWTNSPSLQHTVNFTDGTAVRAIVLNNLYDGRNDGSSFAAGFYCMAPCDSFLFAVYIVHANSGGGITSPAVGMAQVIWAANRDRPVRENATLSLNADGGLVLQDFDGSLVWSANSSGKAVAGLEVTRSGNLVLLDDNNVTVWQSFDHPTDSLVPGQILAQGMRLTPNASANNWTVSNQLYLTVLADGLYGFAGSSPPQLYYSKGYTVTPAANRKTYMTLKNGSLVISASSNVTVAELNMEPGMAYIRLESDGHLKMYQFGAGGWQMVQDIFDGQIDDCAYPTVCGEYGICVSGQCTCPIGGNATYFKQIDDRRINFGCTPVIPISCGSMPDHQLIALSNISYFNYIDPKAALPQIDEESCKKACLRNCSCKAALFQYSGDTSKGSCYLPTQLFSLQVNREEVSHYNSSAYLKVQTTHSPTSSSTSPRHKTISSGAIVGYTFAGVISLLIMIIIGSVVLRKRYQLIEDDEDFGEVSGMTGRFTFEQLKVATEEFSKMLGKGGFGSVFEGQVGEQKIAVKRLDRAGQGKKEFLAEIETIGSIHHINLVRLVGFCAEKSHRLLIYEYMSNGSLDKWIYHRDDIEPLNWHTRRCIITDIAKGLAYLHEECTQRIAHLDIKPQNILLDDNFSAKLSDFGLSKMIERDRSQVMTRMRGTPGYLAPEWLTSQITEKVDIYSFGVVVMEIISGRKNLDYSQPEESIHLISILQEKARKNQLEQLIDSNCDDMQTQKEEVIHMIKLAMWCLQIDCNKRPQMSVVVKVLEGIVNVESNIEFNFVAGVISDPGNDGEMASSAQAPASHISVSHLSGPR